MFLGTSQIDKGKEAFTGLLAEFRSGHIGDRCTEQPILEKHLSTLSKQWDERFPKFPKTPTCYASFMGVVRRGVRDKYLKELIIHELTSRYDEFKGQTIVNPVCVFGRHARDLAQALPAYQVIGTDISGVYNWLYEHLWPHKTPRNYTFIKDNIFASMLDVHPGIVVFFGACGSLSDAVLDYAIRSSASHILCRTCCHDNIGGNTEIVKRPNTLNRMFRKKNFVHQTVSKRFPGHYFSSHYACHDYPRSQTAGGLSHAEEFRDVSQNSVDSDICRTLIDLDRYLYLAENEYQVWTKGELLVATKERVK